jgi:squalene-associated FAD-dependent desaturase
MRIAWGLHRLKRHTDTDDPPFRDWLAQNRQTQRTIDRFWSVVLTSALNETPDHIGLHYARKVFVDALLTDRRGFEVQVPAVPLERLYGTELKTWMQQQGVTIQLNQAAKALCLEDGRITRMQMRNGDVLQADWYVAAVPFDRLLDLLPPSLLEEHSYFRNVRNLETSPITSVHLWYDRPITDLSHVVLVECTGQWVFNRGAAATGEHYLQVVISASRQLCALRHEEVQQIIQKELAQLFPAAARATIVRARVVTEQTATFRCLPGVDRWRPGQGSPVANLVIAGDWTATGWPATMEGAVRSGYLAAQEVARRTGVVVKGLGAL